MFQTQIKIYYACFHYQLNLTKWFKLTEQVRENPPVDLFTEMPPASSTRTTFPYPCSPRKQEWGQPDIYRAGAKGRAEDAVAGGTGTRAH